MLSERRAKRAEKKLVGSISYWYSANNKVDINLIRPDMNEIYQ